MLLELLHLTSRIHVLSSYRFPCKSTRISRRETRGLRHLLQHPLPQRSTLCGVPRSPTSFSHRLAT